MREVSTKQLVQFTVSEDRFRVRFGHKDRDSIQIRLENDGSVYLCDSRDGQQDRWARVSWNVFQAEWPAFVGYAMSKMAEAAKAAGESDA